MPKTGAPYEPPENTRWCQRHNGGQGAFVSVSDFPGDYNYCLDCKREYQREWDSNHRKREPLPKAKISNNGKKIIVHVGNDEKGKRLVRQLLGYYGRVIEGF